MEDFGVNMTERGVFPGVLPDTRERSSQKRYSLSLGEVRGLAREGVIIPVYRALPADVHTPVLTYHNLLSETQRSQERIPLSFSPSFLLESFEGGERLGRYSYIGISPKEGIILRGDEITQARNDGTITIQKADSKDPLKAIQDKVAKTVVKTPGLPPFVGGYVGYIGYEVISAYEDTVPTSNPDILGVPDAILFNYDNVIVFDHVRDELKVVGNIYVEDPTSIDQQYHETTSKIELIIDQIHRQNPLNGKKSERKVASYPIDSNFSEEEYMRAVERIKEYILDGDAFQVVLSQRFTRKTDVAPFSIYRALRRVNPSPFMAYYDFGDFQIIGASPELLLKVDEGTVTTWPIAGTRPRGQTPEEDERLEDELKRNEKENAEHAMLVDLGRNDISKVAAIGSVRVERLMEIERFSYVMHLTSEVRGRLSNERTSLDALRGVFPAGTVSGAPKIRAMQIIDELETEKRGPYAGAMGYVSYDGNLEMAITIRTIVYKDGIAYIQAGGGIVADSDPKAEYEETVNKSKASLRAIELAEEEY